LHWRPRRPVAHLVQHLLASVQAAHPRVPAVGHRETSRLRRVGGDLALA
jgi:hypothetical protein